MLVWKSTAASIILALSTFNSVVRAFANFAGMFEQASKLSALEQAIEDRKALKDLMAKHELKEDDIEAIKASMPSF